MSLFALKDAQLLAEKQDFNILVLLASTRYPDEVKQQRPGVSQKKEHHEAGVAQIVPSRATGSESEPGRIVERGSKSHGRIFRTLRHKEASGDGASAMLITQVSPIAWQHINFYGRYEFTKGPEPINLDVIVEALAKQPLMPVDDEA